MTDTAPPKVALATTSGSSGKTTSAVNLAAVSAERRLRTLMIDTDWQMDASRMLGVDEADLEGRLTLLDVLRDRRQIHDAITASNIEGVDLLPASPALEQARVILAGEKNVEVRLRRAIDEIEHNYDVIYIDCRAGTELPTESGLVASDYVIGATLAGMKELYNTVSLEEYVIKLAGDYERTITLAGILPCNIPSSGAAYQEVLGLFAEQFDDLMLPPVRRSVVVTEAHAQRLPLTARTRWHAVADDYRAVADALTSRGVLPPAREQVTA